LRRPRSIGWRRLDPYSAGHVEASDPDIIMRRSATSERTMTPAKASTAGKVRFIRCPVGDYLASALAPSPQPRPAPTGRALLPGESKQERILTTKLDNNPQLKGRLTIEKMSPARNGHRPRCCHPATRCRAASANAAWDIRWTAPADETGLRGGSGAFEPFSLREDLLRGLGDAQEISSASRTALPGHRP